MYYAGGGGGDLRELREMREREGRSRSGSRSRTGTGTGMPGIARSMTGTPGTRDGRSRAESRWW